MQSGNIEVDYAFDLESVAVYYVVSCWFDEKISIDRRAGINSSGVERNMAKVEGAGWNPIDRPITSLYIL